MAVRRSVRSLVAALMLAGVMAIATGAPTASAVSVDNVTGGKSSLYVPLDNVRTLALANIFVVPLSPAYLSFTLPNPPAVNFPINGGAVESSTMLGTVNHAGGIRIEKQDPNTGAIQTSLDVTDVKIVNGNELVGNALGLVPAPTADLINARHSKDPSTGVIHYEADAQVNLVNATVLNTYFSTDVFKSGMILGHLVSDIQTKKILGL